MLSSVEIFLRTANVIPQTNRYAAISDYLEFPFAAFAAFDTALFAKRICVTALNGQQSALIAAAAILTTNVASSLLERASPNKESYPAPLTTKSLFTLIHKVRTAAATALIFLAPKEATLPVIALLTSFLALKSGGNAPEESNEKKIHLVRELYSLLHAGLSIASHLNYSPQTLRHIKTALIALDLADFVLGAYLQQKDKEGKDRGEANLLLHVAILAASIAAEFFSLKFFAPNYDLSHLQLPEGAKVSWDLHPTLKISQLILQAKIVSTLILSIRDGKQPLYLLASLISYIATAKLPWIYYRTTQQITRNETSGWYKYEATYRIFQSSWIRIENMSTLQQTVSSTIEFSKKVYIEITSSYTANWIPSGGVDAFNLFQMVFLKRIYKGLA